MEEKKNKDEQVHSDPEIKQNGKKESKKTSFFHIDRDMIRFKAHYFLFIGSMGTVLPYIPVVARDRIGVSATSLAVVLTTGQFLTVIAKPAAGYLADYFNRLKLIINVFLLLQSVSCFLILALPPIQRPSSALNRTFSCSTNNTEEDPSCKAIDDDDFSDFKTLTFWLFALCTIITNVSSSCLFTLSDTACCESVMKHKGDFGRQRLFGAVGYGTLAPIGGLLCDLTNDYVATWILMAVLQVFALWNIYYMDLIKPHFSQNLLKDVGKVLKNKEFLTFDVGVFMNGMGSGILWYYLVWFLVDLGGSKFLCGMVNYVQCYVGEIPFMFFSGWFVEKVGHFNLISLSLLAYAIRFLWYSYLQNPWFVLPVEITHGFTYGLLFPAIASYGKLSAKPGTEATTQSILSTTHGGLGGGVGCILAGIGFDNLGGHITFFYIALFGFGAVLLNVFNTFLLKRRSTNDLDISPS